MVHTAASARACASLSAFNSRFLYSFQHLCEKADPMGKKISRGRCQPLGDSRLERAVAKRHISLGRGLRLEPPTTFDPTWDDAAKGR